MKKVRQVLSYIVMVVAIIVLVIFYNKYNFNNFDKNIRLKDATEFVRDNKVKCSKMTSYSMNNKEYNDAMFSMHVEVTPNTPYRVTCMVKTENVENEDATSEGGAHICSATTQERSRAITGTNDWQEMTFMFNSKNETEVDIGFRLGGFDTLSKGKVWFSDFKMEKGVATTSNIWNMACFIFPNIDVNVDINGKTQHVSLQMSDDDIATMQTNLLRFKSSIKELSNEKMIINYDSYVINEPIKTLSHDEDNGFFVSASDVYEYINSYVEEKEYDHIYVAFRMADTQMGENILVNDWIGLGGMDYYGIGFSNIRMPDDRNNLVYKFNYRINTFPEEVFIHEFLHTLERNSQEYNYEIPELHNYAKYGYTEDAREGLKKWYIAYMNKTIKYNGTYIGLPEDIYTKKPVHASNFKYGLPMDSFEEPKGVIEVTQSIISRIKKLFKSRPVKIKQEQNYLTIVEGDTK